MICKYPECRRKAEHSWALVDLCEPHHKALRAETRAYYRTLGGGVSYRKRVIFHKIADQTPWKKSVEIKKRQ